MRINESSRLAMIKSYQQTAPKPLEKKLLKGQSADQLEISSQAQEKLKQTIEDQAHSNGRVQDLKDQIASGTYRIDSDRIADKLLSIWKRETDQ